MAEPLKNSFGPEIPARIAQMILEVHPAFPAAKFLEQVLHEYEPLELMPRARHIAKVLRETLPSDYAEATRILIESSGSRPESTEGDGGMATFFYLPHTTFIGNYGADDFETSIRANYHFTKLFTAEFSIRPLLIHHQARTLEKLKTWATDENVDVRRLVSEGTRPRLPWAPRLPEFQRDPIPVLELLELLKDDPELYVRRSVANNLNDIGKDNPNQLISTAKRWMKDATNERKWVIKHALRFAIKAGNPEALAVLGFSSDSPITVQNAVIPAEAHVGGSALIQFDVVNPSDQPHIVNIDFQIHYIKSNGKSSAKVFKLKSTTIHAKERLTAKKRVSLEEMTTRKHFPGEHRVDALINGQVHPIGMFQLSK